MGNRSVAIVLLVLCALVGGALADTGGSMGGGDWGGGGGGGGDYSGGGGGGYSSSSSSDYSSSSNSYSFSSSGGSGFGGSSAGPVIFMFLAVVMFIGWVIIQSAKDRADSSLGFADTGSTYSAPEIGTVDVSVIRVAVDGRSRKFIQSELARIAKIADTATSDGRATMLREVCLMLRRVRDAWVYGGAINFEMRAIGSAKATFDTQVDDARSRFREETIRNAQGQLTATPASNYTPRSDEGAGLILVSIVLAARTELYTVTRIGDGEDLRQALDALGHLWPATIVAVEIVWQPSEESDRLSSMELEAKYPHPDLIPIQGALVGKTFCTYCGGPFPAELVTCPHCGAPAPGREASAKPA